MEEGIEYELNAIRKLRSIYKDGIIPWYTLYEQVPYIPKIKYVHDKPEDTYVAHYGQLKLFIAEMRFLIEENVNKNENTILLYIGSAPGYYQEYVANIYPKLHLILIDPNEHKLTPFGDQRPIILKKKDNPMEAIDILVHEVQRGINGHRQYSAYIYEDYFTTEMGIKFKEIKDNFHVKFLFMSDIRTSTAEGPMDIDILMNQAQQWLWASKCQPDAACFKFHAPYLNENDDIRPFYKQLNMYNIIDQEWKKIFNMTVNDIYDTAIKTRKYLHPKYDHIDLQSYNGRFSNEMRMIIKDFKPELVSIDCLEFESRGYTFNLVRKYVYYSHKLNLEKIGIDYCTDCKMLLHVFSSLFPNVNSQLIRFFTSRILHNTMEKHLHIFQEI